jgi:hypothetical protein
MKCLKSGKSHEFVLVSTYSKVNKVKSYYSFTERIPGNTSRSETQRLDEPRHVLHDLGRIAGILPGNLSCLSYLS